MVGADAAKAYLYGNGADNWKMSEEDFLFSRDLGPRGFSSDVSLHQASKMSKAQIDARYKERVKSSEERAKKREAAIKEYEGTVLLAHKQGRFSMSDTVEQGKYLKDAGSILVRQYSKISPFSYSAKLTPEGRASVNKEIDESARK